LEPFFREPIACPTFFVPINPHPLFLGAENIFPAIEKFEKKIYKMKFLKKKYLPFKVAFVYPGGKKEKGVRLLC